MPPSPSLKGSLRGDPRGDIHKRGRSFESGLSFREKDDDLALFNELQTREKGNFLIDSTDDFEDLLGSNVKPFPDLKLGLGISTLGESSDLLNTDGDKNDYEWLLTPPDTPLFPSLDDEPAPFNLVHNGRARSRPISISRSSTMERSHRSSRGSPSPQRSSPSPRSGTGSFPGGSSSAPHSNTVSLHSNSPSRRPSPPRVKPSTPPSRSLTPTSRRGSVGLSGIRGTSPVRSSRGNSASPKVKAWQSNIPGFSLEAPPNLRTSLADRPASYIRGSSPASRSSRDSSTKFGRKSMSPSRSIGSSNSQERDRLSSHSKGSIASSGDEDVDLLQSGPASVSDRPMSRKGVSGHPSGRSLTLSKKPTKTFSPSSAPKRSFDSAIRQMDRTTPPNMFRPLLSSVPSSTFYSGKSTSAHCTRNSSLTTSSNASSDLATSAALDTEGNVLFNDDMASDCARATFSDIQDEVFAFDKMDAQTEDSRHEGHNPVDSEELEVKIDVLICSLCASRYRPDELSESEDDNYVCFDCKQKELLRKSALLNRFETTQSSSVPLMDNSVESLAMNDAQSRGISEIATYQEDPLEATQHDSQHCQSCPEESLSVSTEVVNVGDTSHTDMNIDDSESAGISVLLKRPSSVKGHIVHGRAINSSAISFEDLSYSRDLTSSMRSSIGHGNFSASSSVDLTSNRHVEMFMRRQRSCRLSESSSKPQSTASSFSGTLIAVNRSFGHSTSSHEGSSERPTSPLDQVVSAENAELCNVGPSVARERQVLEIDEDRQNGISQSQNVRGSNFTESSLADEGFASNDRVGQVDVAEDLPQCSLSTMSEIEINDSHPSSPRSQIDVGVKEDLECSGAMHHSTDVKDASLESDHADSIVEKSTVTMEDHAGRRKKSLTLEEATDTILFCSSIIHDLAYNAASIAIEKEKENLEPLEGSRPTVTIPDKPTPSRKDQRESTTGRTPKTQKARKRRTSEPEEKPSPSPNHDKPNEPVVRNVGLPKNSDNWKPPKVESKCNCTIM